jgi:DNA topoisomerase VI subunit B
MELKRELFTTNRALEFFSEKELQMQIGFSPDAWPLALVKELIDNGLDACESASMLPEISVELHDEHVSIADNGPGLPEETLRKSLDYSIRVSDKNHYISPSRGQLGNALKCVWAAPFVLNGGEGRVEVETGGCLYEIKVDIDCIAQKPKLEFNKTEADCFVRNGTKVKMYLQNLACLENGKKPYFYNLTVQNLAELLSAYSAFNPHVSFHCSDEGIYPRTVDQCRKWKPSEPTSIFWYSPEKLETLIASYVNLERAGGRKRTVREFVSEFKGLSSTAKQKAVTASIGLNRLYLSDLIAGNGLDSDSIKKLHAAMCENCKPVQPKQMGVVGKDHIEQFLIGRHIDPESIKYKCISGEVEGLPYVFELVFGYFTDDYNENSLIKTIGLNWSPALAMPFYLDLDDFYIDSDDPVWIFIHLASPILNFTDRGKSKLTLPDDMYEVLKDGLKYVTADWTRYKKKQKRDHQASVREAEEYRRATKWSVKKAAWHVMEEAYREASGDFAYPANARQIMYAARPKVIALTGKVKPWAHTSYFTQTLLVDFILEHRELTAEWDVVFDARGHLIEPHTDHAVDLGTREVRNYIKRWTNGNMTVGVGYLSGMMETSGPCNRYKFVLFVEKEGFNELWKKIGLADRYDIGIMSTKGMSNTASRFLIEELSKQDVTILVLHDFDKAGFSIINTMRTDTRRYSFEYEPNIIDIGLRLEDVREMNLQSEEVYYEGEKDPKENLLDSGATEEEASFLVEGKLNYKTWVGKRVEINAMTSKQLAEWIEKKLVAAGVKKVIPDIKYLKQAYRQCALIGSVNKAIDEVERKFKQDKIDIPRGLYDLLASSLEKEPHQSWDDALYMIAQNRSV